MFSKKEMIICKNTKLDQILREPIKAKSREVTVSKEITLLINKTKLLHILQLFKYARTKTIIISKQIYLKGISKQRKTPLELEPEVMEDKEHSNHISNRLMCNMVMHRTQDRKIINKEIIIGHFGDFCINKII